MKQIHNSGSNPDRMPLFLPFSLAKEWLTEISDERYQEILEYSLPATELEFHTVYTLRGPKRGLPRPDEKDWDEFYDWGPKVPEVTYQ